METNPVKVIKLKCMDCCCGQWEEVKQCPAESCPLWPFRLGKNPYRKKKELTEEQLEAKRQAMAQARAKRQEVKANTL